MEFTYEVDLSKLGLAGVLQKEIESTGQKSIFESFVANLLATKYPQGMDDKTRRAHLRLLDKLDAATGPKIDLDARDVDLLSDILMDDKLITHPKQTRLYFALQGNLSSTIGSDKS